MTDTNAFYDSLTPYYHLIYQDWTTGSQRQAEALDRIIRQCWGEEQVQSVLDAACGIGTQALGLAALGYQITASDLSEKEVERARAEAAKRGLDIAFGVADMREVSAVYGVERFDLVIACDNSVPHLLSNADLLTVFRQFYACARPGGGCLISVRDYAKMGRTGTQTQPIEIRAGEGGKRYLLFQVWDFIEGSFDGPIYDLSLYLTEDRGDEGCTTQVFRSRYYAVDIDTLRGLMEEVGFQRVRRVEGFYQPVLVGHKVS